MEHYIAVGKNLPVSNLCDLIHQEQAKGVKFTGVFDVTDNFFRLEINTTPHLASGEADGCQEGSVLAGGFNIEAIEKAFFNHNNDGSEARDGEWETVRKQWRSFKAYLTKHPRQELSEQI